MPDFFKRDEKSEMLEDIIRKENDRRSIPVIDSSFDPSRITECGRRMIYRSIGTPHRKSHVSYIDDLTYKSTVNRWLDILIHCLNIRVLGKDIVTADSKYNITANVNALISFNNDVYVTQIKPVSNNDFNKILKTGALKKDVVEITIYLWLMELTDGLLLYSNNESNDFTVIHVEPYTPIITAIKSKCETMMRNKINGALPERPYKDESSPECKCCEFKNECWN